MNPRTRVLATTALATALAAVLATDVVRFRAARGCLGAPERVRIGVRMVDLYDASHPVTDWLGNAGSYTPWLTSS